MSSTIKLFKTILACGTVCLVVLCARYGAAQAQAQAQNPSPDNIFGRYDQTYNVDVGFTEPIETIKVAASELGIIGEVHVKLGRVVKDDDLLMEIDHKVLTATRRVAKKKAEQKARMNAAEVEYQIKEKKYQKLFQLMKQGAGSPQEVDRAQADAEVARQNIQAILEEIDQYKLEIEQLDAQIERRRVRSPIGGVVVELLKKPGEHVSANDPHIATVVQLDILRVVFHLPTSQAINLRPGERLPLYLPETDQRAEAEIEYVSPITSADSGRVRVDVLIDNQQNQYRSGVRCQIWDEAFMKARNATPRTTPKRVR